MAADLDKVVVFVACRCHRILGRRCRNSATLRRAYERLFGIASDDAVLALRFEDGSGLVFCARSDKNCALLLPGN
ncbi:hypothetical protein [Microvirga tunisiensis]|uniref:Uncharacterized protein n=1 Tax=Microvirga tunisiensis TaxID=2108360 RepID=A0A5N7MQB2_9HYPH|nr:hypothetical protein [Microvirga tunisiensis]MPR11120.1 hypothetical protein [Microvirga tunisiensis]MPR29207.1 hypothetical protein [Microvirga tunisiensis]